MINQHEIRWYQTEAIQSLFDYFAFNHDGNPIIALPTGTGKSHIIGGFIHQTMDWWPDQRFIVATHVKEIIRHNVDKLREAWPFAPVGIYSAGLKSKDTLQPIIFGSIASMIRNPTAFGHRDLLIIDECHLLSPDANTMYQRFISILKETNPNLRTIGLSATPYRLANGMLTDGGLFTDICYDLCSMDGFNRLVHEGFLSPLIPKQTTLQLDVSNVSITGGDFKKDELELAVNNDSVTEQAIDEILRYGDDRHSWLIFASGVKHSEAVADILIEKGVAAATVHSKMPNEQRDERIKAFKSGALQAVVNNNVLTTGFDHPPIDLIGMLRPTVSPGLWVQMLGRGTRPSKPTGKENCLVLDFAGNTLRLGPINDPVVPRRRRKGSKQQATVPAKVCPICSTLVHPTAMTCPSCGHQWEKEINIASTAGVMPLIRTEALPIVQWFNVNHVTFERYSRFGSTPCLKVVYHCDLNIIKEFVHFNRTNFAGVKARRWWRTFVPGSEPPANTDEAMLRTNELRQPVAIRVWINRKYPEILTHAFQWEQVDDGNV